MYIRMISFIAVLLVIVISVSGCGKNSSESPSATDKVESKSTSIENLSKEEMIKCDAKVEDETVQSINNFSFEVYDNMKSEDNLFISPFSMYGALTVLDNGANDKGKEELEKALGIDNLEKTNEQINSLVNSLFDDESDISICNSIYMKKDYTFAEGINDSFINPVKRYFNADVFNVDFTDENTYKDMNEWISKATNGMINPYIKNTKQEANDSGDMVMRILNTIYFQGIWKNKFNDEDTSDGVFNGTNGESNVKYMNLSETSFKYLCQDGLVALSMPYKGNITMDIIIPETKDSNIGEVFDSMSTEGKIKFISDLENADAEEITKLLFPKFEFETDIYDLNPILKNMGVNSIFNDANVLKKISDEIQVSEVKHKAKIQVDENGTKAAAITDIAVRNSCAVEDGKSFIVDRSFVFIIRDTQTNAILFIGEMNNM